MIVIADGALLDAFLKGPELWPVQERPVLEVTASFSYKTHQKSAANLLALRLFIFH